MGVAGIWAADRRSQISGLQLDRKPVRATTESSGDLGDEVYGNAVSAVVNYAGRSDRRPTYNQDPKRTNQAFDERRVTIWNARALRDPPTLDREGLALLAHETAVEDFHDRDEISRVFLPEIVQLLLGLTGASAVFALAGAVLRFAKGSPYHGSRLNSEPAGFPHVDFTPNSSPGLVEGPFGVERMKLRPGQRLVAYNVWRALSPPPQDVPLALCDARTLAAEDLVPAEGSYEECDPPWWNMEAYLVRYNARHRWLYFPSMRAGEVLLFKSFEYGPRWRAGVAHTAFDDPGCPPTAAARTSVEARAIAVFDR
jgi:hypothetical protein